ncbi:MAG: DUF3263 domain-containing protein [Propionibacteriales bacterium]|nr:DUF3263 domain-containing protein [Propionibacteriales bacterium]
MNDLTPRDREIIDFERSWRTHVGRRPEAILETFGVTVATYNAWRRATIEKPEAMKYAPAVVARLRHQKWRKKAGDPESQQTADLEDIE